MTKLHLLIPVPLLFFQTAQDISLGPLTSVIGSLGSAGAAVIVTIYFLSYIKDQNKIISDMKENQLKMQEAYQKHLDDIAKRFLDSQEEGREFFQHQLKTITDSQTSILHDTVIAVKTLENSINTIRNDIQLVLIKINPGKPGESDSIETVDVKKLVKKDL